MRLDAARRIALAAQGLDRPRATGRIDVRHLRRVLRATQLLQIDSVRAVERAQYLPAFARLGRYPRRLLDELAGSRGELIEAWAHEASLLPVERYSLLRWRHRRFAYGPVRRALPRDAERLLDAVEAEVAKRGPVTAADLDAPSASAGSLGDEHRPASGWWAWSTGKAALEELFGRGRLAIAGRTSGFARRYDLPQRVLPAAVLDAPEPSEADAHRQLLRLAARAHGIGTADDLADYFRLRVTEARPRLDELVAAGELWQVAVDGWSQPAYLEPDARQPRKVRARALLAPFDPVVWHRPRAERLFDFHYRIEIYLPSPQRRFGYYVLPFVLGERVVARVDVRADRRAGRLCVPGAFAEDDVDRLHVAGELAAELHELAAWLGLGAVQVGDRGDLASPLARRAG